MHDKSHAIVLLILPQALVVHALTPWQRLIALNKHDEF